MKPAALMTAVAMLVASALAAPNPAPKADPQICYCMPQGCYDSCGQKLCC